MLIANISTYQSLSPFETVEDLNASIRKHRSTHALSKTEDAVLDVLAQYSCKTIGVSFLTKNSIADIIDKSRRTIIRACNRLESLGIIAQHDVKRPSDMRQTSNAIVIKAESVAHNKIVEEPKENTDVTQDMSHQKALKPFKQNPTKVIDTAYVYAEGLRRSMPSEIFEALSSYFIAEDIYKYYGILLRAKRRTNSDILIEDCPRPFVEVIHNIALKMKLRKIKNVAGYMYHAFVSATSRASRILRDDGGLYYDWLA